MLGRCYNKKGKAYKDYGERGITVCEQWRNNYWQFHKDMFPKPPGLTLERRDNDANYTPENCYWATRKVQQRNQRVTRRVTIAGKTYVAADLADLCGHKTDTIVERAEAGLSYEEVIAKDRNHNLDGFKLGAAISAAKRNAMTHCRKGHEWTDASTEWRDNGKYRWRCCKICHEIARKRRKAERGYA